MEIKNFIQPDETDINTEAENNSPTQSDFPERTVMKNDKTRNTLQVHSAVTVKLSDAKEHNTLIDDEYNPLDYENPEPKPRRSSTDNTDSDLTPVSETDFENDSSDITERSEKVPVSDRYEKKIHNLEKKSEKIKRKLELKRKKLPEKVTYHFRRVYDENEKKMVTRIVKDVKTRPAHPAENIAVKSVKAAGSRIKNAGLSAIHSEIEKYEDDNATLRAAHMVEKTGESVLRFGKSSVIKANNRLKESPYKKVSKLKMESERLDSKLSYTRLMAEQQMLERKQNAAQQKKMIKKAQQKLSQKKQSFKAAAEAKSVAEATEIAARRMIEAISHSKAAAIVIIVLLVFICIINVFAGSAFSGLSDTAKEAVTSSYTSSESDIRQAEDYLKWRENGITDFVNNIRNIYIGWDEYNIYNASVNHDPYKLIAYLTARYQNFKYDDRTRNLINEIYDELYHVDVEDVREVRTRQEKRYDADGNEYYVTVSYEYFILNVRVVTNDWDSVVRPKLRSAGVEEHYNLLCSKKGNRPNLF